MRSLVLVMVLLLLCFIVGYLLAPLLLFLLLLVLLVLLLVLFCLHVIGSVNELTLPSFLIFFLLSQVFDIHCIAVNFISLGCSGCLFQCI